jgi:hypothetical protein
MGLVIALSAGHAVAEPLGDGRGQFNAPSGDSSAQPRAGQGRQGDHPDYAPNRNVDPNSGWRSGNRPEGRDGSRRQTGDGSNLPHQRYDFPRQPVERVDENGVRFITAPPREVTGQANHSREDGFNRPDAARRGDERARWERSGPNDLNRGWENQPRVIDHTDHGPYGNWNRSRWSDEFERRGWGPNPDWRPGYVLRGTPPRYTRIWHHNRDYYYADGYWYRSQGPNYVVIAPPRGVYVSVLPNFAQSVVIGGLTYYFAAGTYYQRQPEYNRYIVVDPPAQENGYTVSSNAYEVSAYPAYGQTQAQLEQDRYDCYRWAASETGFDPARATMAPPADIADRYRRSLGACLSGRGYNVTY